MLNRLKCLRWTIRHFSTEAPRYPFSNVVSFAEPSATPTDALHKGRGLMEHVRRSLIFQEKQHMVNVLFSRRHKDRILPGSVLTVHTQQAPHVFSGVLLAVRRRGPGTSFTLRNVVQKMGVEAQFFVNSPDLQRIEVVRKAGEGVGHAGKRPRRAKLTYLRHSPEKMSVLAAGVRS